MSRALWYLHDVLGLLNTLYEFYFITLEGNLSIFVWYFCHLTIKGILVIAYVDLELYGNQWAPLSVIILISKNDKG